MKRKKHFRTSADIRRELTHLYYLVEQDEIDRKKAETMKGILNSIQQSIYGELKEKEIQEMERLSALLEQEGKQ
ncbi:hypothetical protein MKY25_03800 [Geobacillus sp. FSL W8-0032]|uniref:hypothetical protein n=1 Tax=unclassified Geobacillus TaxID=2642459 RepID=UPI0030D798A2